MYTEDLIACEQSGRIKAAKLWSACSQDFSWDAAYLVVQVDLSMWNAVHCGQLTLRYRLDRYQNEQILQLLEDLELTNLELKNL